MFYREGARFAVEEVRQYGPNVLSVEMVSGDIRNGRNRGLEAALRVMDQANLDMGILQETKITDGVYTRASARYRVVATDAPSRHRGGIAMFYREGAGFAVEEVRQYGPNVLSFEVVSGRRRWYIIGCYFASDDAQTIGGSSWPWGTNRKAPHL